MRMHLKNRKIRLKRINSINKINFNSKTLFIFLISLSLVALISGIIFYFVLNGADKNAIDKSISNIFNIKHNYNYFKIFKDSFLENNFNIFLIWVLGLSVIGIFINIIIYFFHIFTLGFNIAAIMSNYGIKGLIGSFCYLFPSKVCYVTTLFIITFFSIKISYKIITFLFLKKDFNIRNSMNSYFKFLFFAFIVVVFICLLETFIDPFFIKLFTKI